MLLCRPRNIVVLVFCLCLAAAPALASHRLPPPPPPLKFDSNGQFKILQVSDMHYRYGAKSHCLDVPESEYPYCSDLNSTAFLTRAIADEKPDLIVFNGDTIDGFSFDMACVSNTTKSLLEALAPAIKSKIPWVFTVGNHDQESDLTRQQLMMFVSKLPHSLSHVNPREAWHYIDGFGNYNLQVFAPLGSPFYFKSVLNLYFLDSGDYIKLPGFDDEYDYIKPSQGLWFERTSKRLEKIYKSKPLPQKTAAPGLAFFHIPLPEFENFYENRSNIETGARREETGSSTLNSGFFTKLVERDDVKGVFVGHCHLNDFCGKLKGISLCYSGGFGYHAYGEIGFARRARVVVAQLEKTKKGKWGVVESIKTWKRLDDVNQPVVDTQLIWSKDTKPKDPVFMWGSSCKGQQH